MVQLEVLDRLIAVVVVLLLLSLLVQSIQGLIKQVLRLKSRQLEDSLVAVQIRRAQSLEVGGADAGESAGLEHPDAGRIMIGGHDMTRVAPAARDVTFVFQQFSLYLKANQQKKYRHQRVIDPMQD